VVLSSRARALSAAPFLVVVDRSEARELLELLQNRAELRLELVTVKRLHDVFVHPHLDRRHHTRDLSFRGQHYEGEGFEPFILTDHFEEIESV